MREELCNRLDRHRARLIKELNITTTFLASLLSKQVISSENKATIESYHVSYQQVDRLIDILQRKPNDKFEPFLDSLRDENSDLYDSLTGGSGSAPAINFDKQRSERGQNSCTPDQPNEDDCVDIGTSSSTPFVIPASSLTSLKKIGSGGYGIVFKAQHSEWGTVAYKKSGEQFIRDRKLLALRNEAEIQWKLNHSNIVRVLAMVLESNNYGIVLEFVRGELLDYIQDNNPDFTFKLSASYDVCLALSYLHSLSPPLIHGDLKIENTLLDENERVKVCDFGFSKWKEYSRSHSKEKIRTGTVTHVPPELWRDAYLRKVESFDVYSYGVCLWEILAGDKPFKGFDSELIKVWVLDNQRPNLESIPSETPTPITDLMKQCWNENISMRPKFSEVKTILEEII